MAQAKKRLLRSRLSEPLPLAALSIITVVVVLLILELTNTTHIFHKGIPATQVIVKAGNPTPTPANNTSTSASSEKTSIANPSRVVGSSTDTQGSTGASTNASQWVISQSGNLTVKQPTANARLQNGSVLSGSAKINKVNFRLIDNKVGVISEGSLSVVNGNFSGTLAFTAQSSTGRLDVFSTDDQGVELNEVQISVSF